MSGPSRFGDDAITAIERNVTPGDTGGTVVGVFGCVRGDGATTVCLEIVDALKSLDRSVALLRLGGQNGIKVEGERVTLDDIAKLPADEEITRPDGGFLSITVKDASSKEANFKSSELKRTITRLKTKFEYVLIDCPPLLGSNLSEWVATVTDQNYIVVRQQRTYQYHASAAVSVFDRINRKPNGVFLNDRRYLIPQSVYRFFLGKTG